MNFRYRIMQFMSGRYGIDKLFYVLFSVAAVISIVNCFVHSWILQMMVYFIIIYAFFRVMSRNTLARKRENERLMSFVRSFRNKREINRQRRADLTHIYKKCSVCKAVLRLPRRKGKHKTVCPRCAHEFTVWVFKK